VLRINQKMKGIKELEVGDFQIDRRDGPQGALLRTWLDESFVPGLDRRSARD
jgi:hypothetical protein